MLLSLVGCTAPDILLNMPVPCKQGTRDMLAVRTQSKSSLTKQRERNRRSQQRFRERHRSTVASLQEQVSAVDEEMLLVAERIQQLSTINEVGLLECSDMPRADRKKGSITWLGVG